MEENGKEKVTWQWFRKKLKPTTIAIIIGSILILVFLGYVIYKRYFLDEPILNLKRTTSQTLPNNLDGRKVAPELVNRHPLAIMVENHPDARPQSGLDKASIIYESMTEGGITRFMAVYGPYDAAKVGPVRSARTYFVDWVSEFKAFYGHVGGNLDALDKIKAEDIADLDQFGLGTKAYWREPKAGVATEHTMYTSTEKLYTYAFETKKWLKEGSFKALKFIQPLSSDLRTNDQTITIDFSSPSYLVSWQYDKTKNVYLRSLGGAIHNDKESGEQLSGTNIIVQSVERRETTTAINESGYAMTTVGTGPALIFSQGEQTKGTWKKTDRTARTLFLDEKGKEISFIPGQFWIEIVPPDIFDKILVTNK